MSENVRSATDDTFEELVIESELPVLVDFWTPWCGPCRMVGPVLEELAGEYAGKLSVIKVNVDESPQVAGSLGIRSIPTIVLYRGGQVVETAVGARPKDYFVEMLAQHLGS